MFRTRKNEQIVTITLLDDEDNEYREDFIVHGALYTPYIPGDLIDPPEQELVEYDWISRRNDSECKRVTDPVIHDKIEDALLALVHN